MQLKYTLVYKCYFFMSPYNIFTIDCWLYFSCHFRSPEKLKDSLATGTDRWTVLKVNCRYVIYNILSYDIKSCNSQIITFNSSSDYNWNNKFVIIYFIQLFPFMYLIMTERNSNIKSSFKIVQYHFIFI